MYVVRVVLAAAALSAGLFGIARTDAQPQKVLSCPTVASGSGKDPSPLISSDNAFGFRLFKALQAEQQGSNLFVSPTSVATALQMAFDGARGSTRRAMDHALSLGGNDPTFVRAEAAALQHYLQRADPRVRFALANSAWLRKGSSFRPAFMQHLHQYYAAKATTLDFKSPSAPGTINGWVNCATHGTIHSIINHIPPQVILYLMNTVYFKGHWTRPFDSKLTRRGFFTTSSGSRRQVHMMHQQGSMLYHATKDVQIARLPYASGRWSMTVVLPRKGLSVAALGQRLDPSLWRSWTSHLHITQVALSLPRIQTRNDLGLQPPLVALGMGQAFSHAADFLGMCTRSCRISDVRHATYLKVDEAGTVASGVTSVSVEPTAISKYIQMAVNRPFVVAITERTTGAVVFLGAISNPN